VIGPKGEKRGALFGRAQLNLAKYASATVGKRVVVSVAPEGAAVPPRSAAGGNAAPAPLTAVVTVAAEAADKTPTGSSAALDEVGAAAERALAGACPSALADHATSRICALRLR
jgi:hypothetical protein